MGGARWLVGNALRTRYKLFRKCTALVEGAVREKTKSLVASSKICNALTNRDNYTREVIAKRHGKAASMQKLDLAESHFEIRRVECRCVDLNQDFLHAWRRIRKIRESKIIQRPVSC